MRDVPISDACDVNPAKPKLASLADDTAVLFVPMAAVDEVTGTVSDPQVRKLGELRKKSYRSLQPGDVIFAKITPCMENGKSAVVPEFASGVGFGSTEFHVLRPKSGVDASYVWHFVRQDKFRRQARDAMTGTVGQERVPAAFVAQSPIPLPPEEVQRQISHLLDSALTSSQSAAAHLSIAARAVDRFRQAVLAAACSGRLTAEWRRDLLDAVESVAGTPNDSNLVPIPHNWTYERLDTLNDPDAVIGYGIVLPGPQIPEGVPYVRQQDVVGGTVRTEGLGRTTAEIANKHSRSSLREGDVLLCIIRNLRVAIVPAGLDGANITQGMVRIRPGERVKGRYLAAYLESPYAQRWMKDQYVGLAMPRINVADARAIPVPLPPIDEQAEIVRRLDRLLGVARSAEAQIAAANTRLERASQSILAKAFRGELSPSAGMGPLIGV